MGGPEAQEQGLGAVSGHERVVEAEGGQQREVDGKGSARGERSLPLQGERRESKPDKSKEGHAGGKGGGSSEGKEAMEEPEHGAGMVERGPRGNKN